MMGIMFDFVNEKKDFGSGIGWLGTTPSAGVAGLARAAANRALHGWRGVGILYIVGPLSAIMLFRKLISLYFTRWHAACLKQPSDWSEVYHVF